MINHLDKYIQACTYGQDGQQKDLQKAIGICRRVIDSNRSDIGPESQSYGIRYNLASLLSETGEKEEAVNQYALYYQELKTTIYQNNKLRRDIGERLIKCYFEGVDVERDLQKARYYIDDVLSFDEENKTALFYLGQYYENGLVESPVDKLKAFQCYEKTSDIFPEARKKLGIMYLEGIGCQKDEALARTFLMCLSISIHSSKENKRETVRTLSGLIELLQCFLLLWF